MMKAAACEKSEASTTEKRHMAIRSSSIDISFCLSDTCQNKNCDRNKKNNLYQKYGKKGIWISFSDFEPVCLDHVPDEK